MSLKIEGLIPVVYLSSLSEDQLIDLFDFMYDQDINLQESNPVIYASVSEEEQQDTSIDTALIELGISRGDSFLIYFDLPEEVVKEKVEGILNDTGDT